MKKYWYVVQKKTGGEYLIGFCYGNSELGELVLLDSMEQYCEEKEYRLLFIGRNNTDAASLKPDISGENDR